MNRPLRLLTSCILSLLLSGAFAQDRVFAQFLAPLRDYPGLEAARATLAVAEANLRQAYDPISLDVDLGYNRPQVFEADSDTAFYADLDVTVRPLIFGDTADTVRRRELELERARLDYRAALIALQVQALNAAQGFLLAEESLAAAREGFGLAGVVLEATQARFDLGSSTVGELREAELGVRESEILLGGAQTERELAELTLQSYVGEGRMSEMPALPVPEGSPLELRRAAIDVELARAALRAAERGLYPVVEARYVQPLTDLSGVTLSINSRNLAPAVGYSYEGLGDIDDSEFQVGVSATLSVAAFEAVEVAEQNLRAARARLETRRREIALRDQNLQNLRADAQRRLELAQARFEDAQTDLAEAQAQEELGISTPLETQRAALALTEARFALQSARSALQGATLDLYDFYGISLLEVQ